MFPAIEVLGPKLRRSYLVPLALFVATLWTTTAVGSQFARSFAENRPFDTADLRESFSALFQPQRWPAGLPFSLTLLAILLAHELGHYVACRRYGVAATPPFFLPAPTPIGTFGAFIRIRSPITNRQALFDIGIAGPLAGFALTLPAIAAGVALSKVLPNVGLLTDLRFSTPPLQRAVELVLFPGAESHDVLLHPIARAGWVGAFATALNLLPIGQLDGGHILYAFVGKWHRQLSRFFVALLALLALFEGWSWLVWAILLLLLGLGHPTIYDQRRPAGIRPLLALAALIIFIGCFTVAPISGADM